MPGSVVGNLVGILLFLLFQVCGMCVAAFFLPREGAGARVLLGSVCGSVMLQWFPVPFAFFLGFSIPAHLCAVCLALCTAAVCFRLGKGKGVPGFSGVLSAFLRRRFLWAVLALWLFFCFLAWKSFLFEDGKIFSSQATYGDMSMHLSFITSLARQGDFPPDYSLLPDVQLCYPFLSDSISSSLYLFGASLKLSYFLPMVAAGAQVFFGFYLFASRFSGSPKKGALAWTLFFFNGGFGFIYFLNGEKSFSDLLQGFYQTPTNLVEKGLRWVNVVVDMMLPQRATLFGWAVLFPALYVLYRAVFETQKKYFLYAGVLAGLLPMIHTHSFLVLALVCGVWLVCSLLRGLGLEGLGVKVGKCLILLGLPGMCVLFAVFRQQSDSPMFLLVVLAAAVLFLLLLILLLLRSGRAGGWKPLLSTWGVLLLSACALAVPQLFIWTFRQAGTSGFIRGHFGWIIPQCEGGYFWFYVKNLGLGGVLALGGLLTANCRSFSKYAPALLIWFLAEFVEFQPNDYDNNKLLYAAFALLCCAAAEFAARVLGRVRGKGLRYAFGGTALALCVTSAVMTMARETVSKYELFGEGAIAMCEYVEENLPADAVILTDTRHNNEVASLAGRNIVCGSPSYLFYHGLPYSGSEMAAREMYEEPDQSLDLYRQYMVDYVLVSDFERSSYRVREDRIAALFPKVYDDGVRALYRVTEGEGHE